MKDNPKVIFVVVKVVLTKLNKPNKDDFDYGQLAYLSTKKFR